MSGGSYWPPDKWPCGTQMYTLYNSITREIGPAETQKFGPNKDRVATVWIASFVDGVVEKHMKESNKKTGLKATLQNVENTGSRQELLRTLGEIGPQIFLDLKKITSGIKIDAGEASALKAVFIEKGFDQKIATSKSISIGSVILKKLSESKNVKREAEHDSYRYKLSGS